MKIVSSVMHKGGTGKSTLAQHLTHFLAEHGHKVLLVDVDTQGNSAGAFVDDLPAENGVSALYQKQGHTIAQVRPAKDNPKVHVLGPDPALDDVRRDQVPQFVKNLRQLGKAGGYDYIVLDTPPTPRDNLSAPLDVSDFVFVPLIPDRFGIENAYKLNKMVQAAQERRHGDLHFLGFILNQFNPRVRGHREVHDAMVEAFTDELCPSVICYRAAYVNASFESKPVWKRLERDRLLNGATREASREIRGALNWLYEKMEKSNGN